MLLVVVGGGTETSFFEHLVPGICCQESFFILIFFSLQSTMAEIDVDCFHDIGKKAAEGMF